MVGEGVGGPVSVVAHHVWKLGGATWTAVSTARGLCGFGLGPVAPVGVVAPHPRVWEVLRGLGCVSRFYSLLGARLFWGSLFQKSVLWVPVRRVVERYKDSVRLVWIDYSTYAPLLPLLRSRGVGLVEYIHFPYEVLAWGLLGGLPGWLAREIQYYFEPYLESRVRRRYLWLALRFEDRWRRRDPFEAASLVLVSSEWTRLIVRHVYGRDPVVLSTPVDAGVFAAHAGRGFWEREPVVVAVGRISREKRFEDLIEAVAMSETRPRVRIVGALKSRRSSYYRRLVGLARRLGVEVEFHTNVSREELAGLLGSSRVFVHPTRGEHFGIVVVEAMAAGLPVVVHRSGGPYHDITGRGRYGLSFDSIEELAEHIDRLVSDEGEWRRYHELSLERVGRYTVEAFLDGLRRALRGAGLL